MQRFVIGEQESGYIEEKALEDFLKMQFGSDKNYDIKKSDEANYVYWSYSAPRELNKALLGANPASLRERLVEHVWSISAKKTLHFEVFESKPNAKLPTKRTIQDQSTAEQAISVPQSEGFDCKIFCLVQKDSLRPFLITAPLLWNLLDTYKIPAHFLDVLFAVHTETHIAEESYGNVFLQTLVEPSPAFELSYQLKYVEANHRPSAFPWSTRRTEVFSRIWNAGEGVKSFWLIFHPKEDSELSNRISQKAQEQSQWSVIRQNPVRQHIDILSTYLDNWRPFLGDLGTQYSELKMLLWTTEFEDEANFNRVLNFKSMRSLRGLEERVQMAEVILGQTANLLQVLIELNQNIFQSGMSDHKEFTITENALNAIRVKLDGHQNSAQALEIRIQGILKLVSSADQMTEECRILTLQGNGCSEP
ncbi:hypothetical protein MPH_01000 [Macrophomina phaseolina MS6]|uniref:CorA-like transporter domain-containing protein n=1 Tax=Macrophomina phaseolina (strain MS6) TaxID=1126212 RepID=K2SYL4_MACPH|nr:hypothetical protein MPH_01000 [Macrophomina phaseolina MS6]